MVYCHFPQSRQINNLAQSPPLFPCLAAEGGITLIIVHLVNPASRGVLQKKTKVDGEGNGPIDRARLNLRFSRES